MLINDIQFDFFTNLASQRTNKVRRKKSFCDSNACMPVVFISHVENIARISNHLNTIGIYRSFGYKKVYLPHSGRYTFSHLRRRYMYTHHITYPYREGCGVMARARSFPMSLPAVRHVSPLSILGHYFDVVSLSKALHPQMLHLTQV